MDFLLSILFIFHSERNHDKYINPKVSRNTAASAYVTQNKNILQLLNKHHFERGKPTTRYDA